MIGSRRLRQLMLVRYAQAVSSAQLLEQALATANFQIDLTTAVGKEKWDRLKRLREREVVSARTMGKSLERLVDNAKGHTSKQASDFYRDLRRLIDDRDLIIHRFFVERAEQLESKTGLNDEIDELEMFRRRCVLMTGVLLQAQTDSVMAIAQRVNEVFRAEEERRAAVRQSLLAELERLGQNQE